MKKLLVTASMVLVMTLPAMAAVESVIIHLDGGDSYTVPAGKVLLIHNINLGGVESVFLSIINGGETNLFISSYFGLYGSSSSNPKVNWPLTVPENTRLEMTTGNGYWVFFGYLVDPSDLYVNAAHEFNTASLAGPGATLGIKTQTAKPLRFSMESSDALASGWSPLAGATVTPTADKTKYLVEVPVMNDIRFYRSKARPRE